MPARRWPSPGALAVARVVVIPAVLLATLAVAAALAPGVLGQPSDDVQVRMLLEREVAALDSDDLAALYRITDLDFRSLCPFDRFTHVMQALPHPAGARSITASKRIAINRPGLMLDVTLVEAGSETHARFRYVKEGGRWYRRAPLAWCGLAEEP